ncbi:MAG: Na+ dependent nucleoside transporter N-terminal domain-containing protein, partial [Myxococcota bacterium]|nr:Na+ dependent nucleoside transporter N-terminal domain-containing protein [Myxococcota bacterium]
MTGFWLVQTAAEGLAAAREGLNTPFPERLMGLVGMATMIGLAWVLSTNRQRIPWRLVATGLVLQVVFGLLVLKTAIGRGFFRGANHVFLSLLGFAEQGAGFLFGNLVHDNVPVTIPGGSPDEISALSFPELWANAGASFAFSILPTIIFFASLVSVLYYLRIMEWVVKGIAFVMHRTMHTSGAETLSVAGNIFVGPTESPLLVRPFVNA